MKGLPTWDVKGDQQSTDFFRVYSTDFPYVEGQLHDNFNRLTLLFSGRENHASTSVTFTLTEEDKNSDSLSNKARRSMPSGMFDKDVQCFDGWFLHKDRKVPIEISAKYG